jgi:hypothetical protein
MRASGEEQYVRFQTRARHQRLCERIQRIQRAAASTAKPALAPDGSNSGAAAGSLVSSGCSLAGFLIHSPLLRLRGSHALRVATAVVVTATTAPVTIALKTSHFGSRSERFEDDDVSVERLLAWAVGRGLEAARLVAAPLADVFSLSFAAVSELATICFLFAER